MAYDKPSLETLLSTSEGNSFLFLGREGLFTQEEIARFLKKYKISMTQNFEEGVVAVVEHHQLNPVEDDISNMAYDAQIPLYKLVDFEKLLSHGINDDELLMGIKLANDQGRVFRLLGNANISNTLFVKLLSMYEWDDEEEDNREDRDTIMYTLRRYISIKPNEEDLLYSYLTLRRLATEASDPKLLLALIGFPNFEFIVRGKEKVSLRETIARNKNVDNEVIQKLISLRDAKVEVALASNKSVPVKVLEVFAKKNSQKLNEALASNRQINDSIFDLLLAKEQSAVELLLLCQPINMKRVVQVEKIVLDDALLSILGANEKLDEDVVWHLSNGDNLLLLEHLSSNVSLSADILVKIYEKKLDSTMSNLARNASVPVSNLEDMYEAYAEDHEIMVALGHNASLPVPILKALFSRDDLEINKGLATNASLPMELLDILKVDTRLQNYLAQNPVFIKEYETVLDYDKNAVQF